MGLCSLAFHTFADELTEALDSLSIMAFVLTAVIVVTHWNVGRAVAAGVALQRQLRGRARQRQPGRQQRQRLVRACVAVKLWRLSHSP